jgi:hypothetical protein
MTKPAELPNDIFVSFELSSSIGLVLVMMVLFFCLGVKARKQKTFFVVFKAVSGSPTPLSTDCSTHHGGTKVRHKVRRESEKTER